MTDHDSPDYLEKVCLQKWPGHSVLELHAYVVTSNFNIF